MRNYRRGRNPYKFGMIIALLVLLIMAVGYSAFSTNIDLSSKGNIIYTNVKFDANGGSVDLDSKQVKVGSSYGDLPTPKKDGYNFLGWHGKNMLYLKDMEGDLNGLHYVVQNETLHIYGTNTQKSNAYGLIGYDSLYKEFEQNKTYTFSAFDITDSNVYAQINYYPNNSTSQAAIHSINSSNNISVFTTPSNYEKFAQIFVGIKSSADSIDETFKLQIEEGSFTNTKWEPYFITKDTEVVQKEDHTLIALWESN